MKGNSLLTLLFAVFIALLGIGVVVPVMPIFATRLGAGGFALGMVIAVFSFSRGVLLPLIGNLSDRWGRKRFLASGLAIYGLAGLLIPQASSVAHLLFIRAIHGVGSAMIVPIAMAYISVFAPPGKEGRYMSYLNIAIFSGIGCGPIFGGLLADTMGLEAVFYAMAFLSIAALLLVLVNMGDAEQRDPRGAPPLLRSMAQMLTNPGTAGILLARYATMIIMVPSMAFLPLLMSDWSGHNSGLHVGVVIACRTLTNAVLQLFCGKLADRWNKLVLLLSGALLMAGIVTLLPHVSGYGWMVAAYVMLGSAEALVWAVLGAYASIEARERFGHGTMMGVFNFAMSCGVLTGALLAGTAMDGWGISHAYHLAGGTVGILCLIAAWLIVRQGWTGSGHCLSAEKRDEKELSD